VLQKILNIGIKEDGLSAYQLKIRQLFNGLTAGGVLAAIVQGVLYTPVDEVAGILHFSWGFVCFLSIIVHSKGSFHAARVMTCVLVILLGGAASARIGQEYYPHFASFGIMVAPFIFFDLVKEWRYIVGIVLLGVLAIAIVETNYFKNPEIVYENPYALRLFTLLSTIAFVAFEIVVLVRLNWLSENSISFELEKKNEQLNQSNNEKNILLQEIHHRVKNNFQVVLSLIKLQSEDVSDEKAIQVFKDLRLRFSAIALMHQKMYQSTQIGKIDLQDYLNELTQQILEATNIDKSVKIEVTSDVQEITNDAIIPLSLLLNELITNSMKHGFVDDTKEHVIQVELVQDLSEQNLIYRDNGRWLVKPDDHTGFGLELIELLTQQLQGTFQRLSDENGTVYTFKFPGKI
jgi:two-component system, sensor histidine kinase PdtaS